MNRLIKDFTVVIELLVKVLSKGGEAANKGVHVTPFSEDEYLIMFTDGACAIRFRIDKKFFKSWYLHFSGCEFDDALLEREKVLYNKFFKNNTWSKAYYSSSAGFMISGDVFNTEFYKAFEGSEYLLLDTRKLVDIEKVLRKMFKLGFIWAYGDWLIFEKKSIDSKVVYKKIRSNNLTILTNIEVYIATTKGDRDV